MKKKDSLEKETDELVENTSPFQKERIIKERDETTVVQALVPDYKNDIKLEKTGIGTYSTVNLDYLPIKRREMQQRWRYLRRKS